MSVTRKIQWDSIYCGSKRQWLLALGIALTPWFAATGWAENFDLESVDFKTVQNQTHIMLHTGSIVPVQKILTSDNKLILEIDQINASQTVRTNFTGASNISHVIMQPINDHKVRMIIRGENLAPPTIAFFNPSNNTASISNPDFQNPSLSNNDSFHRQTQETLQQIQDSGMQLVEPTTLKLANKPTQAASKPQTTLPPPNTNNTADTPAKTGLDLIESEGIPFSGLVDNSTKGESSSLTPANLPAATEKVEPLNLTGMDMPNTSNELLEKAKNGRYNNYILGGLLALLALGVSGAVIHKIMKLKQVEPDLEELLLEQNNGKKVSFKDMASAYRSKHDLEPKGEHNGFSSKPNGKKHVEDLIGLRSLNQMDLDSPAAAPAKPMPKKPAAPQQPLSGTDPFAGKTPTMEQLISMVQAVSEPKQPAAKPPAPSKQAINQYRQNEKPKAPPAKKATFPDETMVKEMKRAQALQQELLQQAQQQIAAAQNPKNQSKTAPVNRAMAAQKTVQPVNFKNAPATNPVPVRKPASPAMNAAAVGKNGPLPGNPEVLNFLRNVAELMEKDGKPQIANSIHKNLKS
ncbi:hypothetical protein [Vampirovibrio sp.]|uniref:hypothetical protein n=1 Tax=Vampirovibrio sp. TaxID=2717857 RepID=UPI0035949054